MNELLKKIYENVIAYEDDTLEVDKALDKQVKDLLEPYKNQFNEKDMETIRQLMYAILLKAEQEGFQLGVKYSVQMILKLLMDL